MYVSVITVSEKREHELEGEQGKGIREGLEVRKGRER